MCNCEKLLRAFIEAQGYEVEERYDIYVSGVYIKTQDVKEQEVKGNQFAIINKPNYKVTKKVKDNPVGFLFDHDGKGIVTELTNRSEWVIHNYTGDGTSSIPTCEGMRFTVNGNTRGFEDTTFHPGDNKNDATDFCLDHESLKVVARNNSARCADAMFPERNKAWQDEYERMWRREFAEMIGDL